MLKYLSFLIIALSSITAISQTTAKEYFDNYKPIVSQGLIPDVFVGLSKDRLQTINSKSEKLEDEFNLKIQFLSDELLLSGDVLFGDPITKYVNEVAEKVIPAEYKNKVFIFVSKSPVINAFCTGNGYIFINIGFIANLNNEAELATTILHELGHYIKKHSFIFFKIEKESEKDYFGHKALLNSMQRSQKHEFEADSIERVLLYKNNYNYICDAAIRVLDLCNKSIYPIVQVQFDKNYFNDIFFKIPKCYFKENVDKLEYEENSTDDLFTHPNVGRRKENVNKIKIPENKCGDVEFTISQGKFNFIKELSRFECVRQNLLNRDYANCIYEAYILLKKYPDNKYLETSIAKALYGIAKYKNNNALAEVIFPINKVKGESQQLNYLFKQLDSKQTTVLALKYITKIIKKYPEYKNLDALQTDLIDDLVLKFELKLDNFVNSNPPSNDEVTVLDYTLKNAKGYKPYPIKSNNATIKQQQESAHFYLIAFVNEMKDPNFVKKFNDAYSKIEKYKLEKSKTYATKEEEEKVKKENYEKNGSGLKTKKIYIYDPSWVCLGKREDEYIEAEKNKLILYSIVNNNFSAFNIQNYFINKKNLKKEDITKFNTISKYSEWVNERNNNSDIEMLSITNDENLTKLDGFDSELICFIYIYSYNGISNYYFKVFNLNTGKKLYSNYENIGSGKFSEKVINKLIASDIEIISK